MKKLAALFLSVGVLFSMSACGGSKVSDDALDALEAAIQNLGDMKSADLTMGIDATVDSENAVISLDGSYNFETSDPQMMFSMDMSSQGQKVEDFMQIYLNKEGMYANMMDIQKYKVPMDEAFASMPDVSFDKETLKIPKDNLKEFLKEASLKGNTLTLVFDTDKLNKQVDKENSSSANALTANTKDAKVKEFKLVATLNNKQFSKADVTANVSQKVNDKDQEVKMKMSVEFKNVGKNQQIKFPADLNTYPDASSTGALN